MPLSPDRSVNIRLHKINFEIFPLPIGERVRVRGI
jgi:hypothetical protein